MENRERGYELRNEKGWIIGQIPPTLIRYGTIILFAVMAILFGIAYSIPYKQVYLGTIIFHKISEPSTIAYIRFANDKALTEIDKPIPITIHLDDQDLTLQLISTGSKRDTLNRYPSNVDLSNIQQLQLQELQDGTYDFTIVQNNGNLLGHLVSVLR